MALSVAPAKGDEIERTGNDQSANAERRASILPGRITTATLASFVRSVPSVDEVGVTERVASLSTRSIKKDSKMAALLLAVRMMDLTTLEGKDTPGKVAQMSSKAIRPDPIDPDVPSVAAVCVYPAMVPYARQAVEGTGVKVAAVATYFPSGQVDAKLKMEETKNVVAMGADEVDMVIDRGSFLSGRYFKVFDEIRKAKDICGSRAHLKVILETGELGNLDEVRRASMLAMAAGADFIKTSTGKVQPAATLPVTLVMLEAIGDFYGATGVQVGMKPAGGIRTAKDAIRYLVVLNETLGSQWMTPDWFRFGASTLLNDVLMQIRWLKTGRYQSDVYFTKD
jgi:deoxyribose-phosphate aldolase